MFFREHIIDKPFIVLIILLRTFIPVLFLASIELSCWLSFTLCLRFHILFSLLFFLSFTFCHEIRSFTQNNCYYDTINTCTLCAAAAFQTTATKTGRRTRTSNIFFLFLLFFLFSVLFLFSYFHKEQKKKKYINYDVFCSSTCYLFIFVFFPSLCPIYTDTSKQGIPVRPSVYMIF